MRTEKLLLISCYVILLSLYVTAVPTEKKDPSEKKDKELSLKLINVQICSDMLHGTDDYFSEDRDSWYADSVTPSVAVSPGASSSEQSTQSETSTTSESSTTSSSSESSSSSSGSSSSSSSSSQSSSSDTSSSSSSVDSTDSSTSTDSGSSGTDTSTPAPAPTVDYTEPEVPDVSDDCPT